ncbi:glycosyl transferase [Flavobacterium sp. KMS]|uniref:glycosyltransferase n=1 Tax=Flavobacterium sp. KMS TaxID=1566023 RepID=UPI00057DD8FB|nr:glycosyltransferase [Flavobacterium sp. KMS]KIA99798.1 glycosyl transferase [Flavobacterium sp. KMS]
MKLLIVSNAPLIYKDKYSYAYGPYVNELTILRKFSDELFFCCPVWENDRGLLISKIPFDFTKNFKLIDSNLNTLKNAFLSVFYSIYNVIVLFKAMKTVDHIHLRCPGNIGLLGCLVQMFFPNKQKTAKYAGNWDLQAKQPLSYKLQKWILSNTFLTRNMQVLVYGEWEGSTKNIKHFFTATYAEKEKVNFKALETKKQMDFVFVGTLVSGKNPLYAIQLVEGLYKKGYDVSLSLYGEGVERIILEKYILENDLKNYVFLHGNQDQQIIKSAYQNSGFVILPSKSEGWPKAIAEGMFWGCIPVATSVSCVPFMLDYGNRGVLLKMNLLDDLLQLEIILKDKMGFVDKSEKGSEWSQKFTTDVFETEIKKLLQP